MRARDVSSATRCLQPSCDPKSGRSTHENTVRCRFLGTANPRRTVCGAYRRSCADGRGACGGRRAGGQWRPRGDRRHRREAQLHGAGHRDQHDRDQRRSTAGAGHHLGGGCRRQSTRHLHAHRGSRTNRIRNARPVGRRRQRGHGGFLSGRNAALGIRRRPERPDRDRCGFVRPESCRGAARSPGHPVRFRFHGRHHQAGDESAEARRLGGCDGLQHFRHQAWQRQRRRQPDAQHTDRRDHGAAGRDHGEIPQRLDRSHRGAAR